MPPHPLRNFEIEEYYENKSRFNETRFNELRFNCVYSQDNLPNKIKLGAYMVNLQDYLGPDTHWIALYIKINEVIYFDSFGVEHVPKEIERFIGHKNTKTNIFRIQTDNSIMCGYFCIVFIDFMFAGRSLIDFTSLFSYFK